MMEMTFSKIKEVVMFKRERHARSDEPETKHTLKPVAGEDANVFELVIERAGRPPSSVIIRTSPPEMVRRAFRQDLKLAMEPSKS
jgi:hypothetical protein